MWNARIHVIRFDSILHPIDKIIEHFVWSELMPYTIIYGYHCFFSLILSCYNFLPSQCSIIAKSRIDTNKMNDQQKNRSFRFFCFSQSHFRQQLRPDQSIYRSIYRRFFLSFRWSSSGFCGIFSKAINNTSLFFLFEKKAYKYATTWGKNGMA